MIKTNRIEDILSYRDKNLQREMGVSLCFMVLVACYSVAPLAAGNDEIPKARIEARVQSEELAARKAVVNAEGLTNEEVAKASVDETSRGEQRFVDKNKEKPDHGNYENVLQTLYDQLSDDGKHTVSEQQIQQLEVVAKEQQNNEVVDVIDSSAALPPSETGNGLSRNKRQLVKNENSRWEKAIVPYSFDKAPAGQKYTDAGSISNVMDAMKYLEDVTCLKFPKWTPSLKEKMNLTHSNFLIFVVASGCWSFVGNLHKKSGQHIAACGGTGVAIHELGHALGMPHEQDRSDRDRFVEQHPENASPKYKGVFSGGPSTNYALYHGYDISSRMHYGKYYFSWNGRPTLSILDPDREFLLGRRADSISHYDLLTLTDGYKCIERNCPADKKSLKCENDGFLAITNGVCGCKCVSGLTGPTCSDVLKKIAAPSSWPAGDYGLAMTKDGCPNAAFITGSRYHALDKGAFAQGGHNFKPTFSSRYMEDQFCMSNTASNSTKWGAGKYCVYQKGDSCPSGFTSGFILYDDDKERAGDNKVNGSLPKGEYGKDTKYYYCCRNDGSASEAIALPTDKPFHLFRYGGTCQRVKGMRAVSYYFMYDTEKTITTGLKSSVHPDFSTWWGNVWLYYCYYYKINYDCGGQVELTSSKPSTIVTSPNYPNPYPAASECNWIIRSPKKSRIHIEMVDLDITDSSSHACVDSLELRYNMIGQSGPRFCGKHMKRSIVSDENRIMLTLHSKLTVTKKGFKVKLSIVPDSKMCYNMEDDGVTYRGNVSYTQHLQRCIPWEKATHCKVNAFAPKYMDKGLIGNSHCRNPNDAPRPWCYFNEYCEMNFCDVCAVEHCYDVYNDCAELMERDTNFCVTQHGYTGCHKSCKKCAQQNMHAPTPCSKPNILDSAAKLVAADAGKSSVSAGESVTLECDLEGRRVTSSLTCLTDGQFEGQNPFCHLKCAEGWLRDGDRCYKIIKEKKLFAQAQAYCSNLNASLASVQTKAENTFLLDFMIGSGLSAMYLGLTDKNSEKKYKWVDGAQVTFTNWAKNEPNNAKENCVQMNRKGEWNDIYCQYFAKPFVCKKPFIGSDTPCSDERSDCVAIVTRNADVCMRYPVFASRYCRATCGLCPHLKCRSPGSVNNAKISTPSFYLSAGDYVAYTCNQGFVHKSGHLKRACIPGGRITGSPPVCTPLGELDQSYGLRRIPRGKVDSHKTLIIYDTNRTNFERSGIIKAWEIYSRAQTDMVVQIWRRENANRSTEFTLVGQNMVHLRAKRVNTIKVPTFEQIEVKAGDLIGWYYPSGPVGLEFDSCNDDYAALGFHKLAVDRLDKFAVGSSQTVPIVGKCRMYSIAALLAKGASSKYTNIALSKYGTKCSASYQSHTCQRAIDGQLVPYDSEWISDGGQGTWIKLEFLHNVTLAGFRFMQRHCACGQNKGMKLEFSDGSSQHVTLNKRPGTSASDEHAMGWDSYEISLVDTSYVKITVDSVYTTQNNGFIEIEVYAVCLSGFTRFRDACYKLHKTPALYFPAEETCKAYKALHTSVQDAAENQFLVNLKNKASVSDIYIGLSDRVKEGTWVWEDGTNSSYRNWGKGQPGSWSSSYDCASQKQDGTWMDLYCKWHYARAYVCKWTFPETKSDSTMIGNVGRPRSKRPGKNAVHISTEPENKIPFDGKIDTWRVFSDKDTTIVMQVWRRDVTTASKFTLVGQNFVQLKAGLSNLIHVPDFEKINVKKDDFLGFYIPNTETGITYDRCSSSKPKTLYHKNFPTVVKDFSAGYSVDFGTVQSCITFSYGAVITPGRSYGLPNVASAKYGGACAAASSNASTCNRVIDSKLTSGDGEWQSSGGNTGVGLWLNIKLAKTYRVVGARFMQRLSKDSQSKDLTLTFSDNSTQSVTLSKRTGSNANDVKGLGWDAFALKPVNTISVKIEVSSVYSTLNNGFVEIEIIAECEEGWTRFHDSCYRKYNTMNKFFFPAQDICQLWGGNIASIHSDAENEFIVSMMDKTENDLYIGLTDQRAEDVWTWLDSTPLDYTNWKNGAKPGRSTSNNCVQISKSTKKWGHLYCQWHYAKHFVCKKSYQSTASSPGEAKYLSMDTLNGNSLPGTNINGTVHNATLVDGISGKALSFNGVDQYVYLGQHRDECFGNLHMCPHGYTLAVWLNMEGISRYREYYVSNGGQDNYYSHGVSLYRIGSSLRSTFRDQFVKWEVTASSSQAPTNTWLNVVLVWSRQAGLCMYINNTLVARDNSTSAVKSYSNMNNNFVLGKPNRGSDYGKTLMDDFAFWPRAVGRSFVEEIGLLNACPNGWTKRNNFCYKAFTEKKNYVTAEKVCSSEGAHISSVQNVEEAKFLIDLGGKVDIWIGFNDREREGKFKWADGSTSTYTAWGSGQPNNWSNQDCAVVEKDLTWGDYDCVDDSQPYVCKKKQKNLKDLV